MEENTVNVKKKRDRIGVILYVVYVLLLLASVLLFAKIVGIQLFFKPDPKIESALTPGSRPRAIEPVRGNIIDCNGRLLAMSCPTYQIAMDCTVMREEYAKDKESGAVKEEKWLATCTCNVVNAHCNCINTDCVMLIHKESKLNLCATTICTR